MWNALPHAAKCTVLCLCIFFNTNMVPFLFLFFLTLPLADCANVAWKDGNSVTSSVSSLGSCCNKWSHWLLFYCGFWAYPGKENCFPSVCFVVRFTAKNHQLHTSKISKFMGGVLVLGGSGKPCLNFLLFLFCFLFCAITGSHHHAKVHHQKFIQLWKLSV